MENERSRYVTLVLKPTNLIGASDGTSLLFHIHAACEYHNVSYFQLRLPSYYLCQKSRIIGWWLVTTITNPGPLLLFFFLPDVRYNEVLTVYDGVFSYFLSSWKLSLPESCSNAQC